jgi:hypothetical protein
MMGHRFLRKNESYDEVDLFILLSFTLTRINIFIVVQFAYFNRILLIDIITRVDKLH